MKEYLSSAEEVLQEQNSSPEGAFQSGSGETAGAVRPQQAEGGGKRFPC